jgi:hypothetical protein
VGAPTTGICVCVCVCVCVCICICVGVGVGVSISISVSISIPVDISGGVGIDTGVSGLGVVTTSHRYKKQNSRTIRMVPHRVSKLISNR